MFGVGFSPASDVTPRLDWYVHSETPLGGWKMRMVFDSRGRGWAGGVSTTPTKDLLYRYQDGTWQLEPSFPLECKRTFVMDVDPADRLWVCPMAPYEDGWDPREHLELLRFDGQEWTRRTLPDTQIWPQAMDMVSPTEGWLAGNGRRLLYFGDDDWYLAVAEPNERFQTYSEKTKRSFNFLDIHMVDGDTGWACGTISMLAEYRDGVWRMIEPPADLPDNWFRALDVDENGTVWIAGDGMVASYSEGTWRWWRDLPVNLTLLDILAIGPEEVLAVGSSGTIIRYDGRQWQRVFSASANALSHFAEKTPGQPWILGNNHILAPTQINPPYLRSLDHPSGLPHFTQRESGSRVMDLNGDRRPDLLISQKREVQSYINLGGGQFVLDQTLMEESTSGFYTQVHAAKVDHFDRVELMASTTWPNRNPRLVVSDRLGVAPQWVASNVLGNTEKVEQRLLQGIFDLDQDGDLDLYCARMVGNIAYPYILWNQDNRFEEDVNVRFAYSATPYFWGDLDGDGDLDAISPGYRPSDLLVYRNEGDRVFSDMSAESGLDATWGAGYGRAELGDLDMDGDLDLIIFRSELEVWFNDGTGFFVNRTADFPTMIGELNYPSVNIVVAGDLNHNGYAEIFLMTDIGGKNERHILSRGSDGRWRDLDSMVTEEIPGVPFQFSDLDQDGDLDILVEGKGPIKVVDNVRDDRQFLKFDLVGTPGNYEGIGTRVWLYREEPNGESRLVGFQQVGVSGQNQAQYGLGDQVHFGLAQDGTYRVRAMFPTGEIAELAGLAPGQTLELSAHRPLIRPVYATFHQMGLNLTRVDPWGTAAKWIALFLLLLGLYRYLLPRRTGPISRTFACTTIAAMALYLVVDLATLHHSGVRQMGIWFGAGLFLTFCAVNECGFSHWISSHYLGPYRLQGLLGEGGMGVVYRARNVVRRRTVALKTFPPELTHKKELRRRFQREAAILKSLKHPNIVKVYETGEIDGRGFISMELLQGVTLRRLMAEQGPLPWRKAIVIFEAVAEALAYIHDKGILHRDLKADNIFLTHDALFQSPAWRFSSRDIAALANGVIHKKQVILMDFGLSNAEHMETITRGNGLMGTLAYIAPEQVIHRRCDHRSDIYGLGVLMFETLCGRLPYQGAHEISLIGNIRAGRILNLREIAPNLPLPLTNLVMKALAFSPEQRFGRAQEMVEALADMRLQGVSTKEDTLIQRLPAASPPGEPEDRGPSDVPVAPLATAVQALPVVPSMPLSQELAARTQTWRNLFTAAKYQADATRFSEARITMADCMDQIEAVAVDLSEADWTEYEKAFQVEEVLSFMESLSQSDG
ncbi:protein kinase domain-containing protein [Sulfidibacter corallicola]|uniref:Protein kinase n=1 Tax=Sulfidibacter corallicola TaxID=2818388 RepID=A0A8A4TQG4_SULCO|nr:protein kinase [Sulfidibacter corallicola]QTD52226.1 protein kinase [Sulfidibacter corallicola]